jgi:GNAT superfamily N-acetyltransferase
MAFSIHKGYVCGCIGKVVELHARYYHRLVGFDLAFECKLAQELSEFCQRYDERGDGLWLAMHDGEIEGSIAVDGSGVAQDGAHLRWFIASDKGRGTGTGTALLGAALDFCRAKKYPRVYLWTFDGLEAARHLYEKAGFRLAHQQRGTQWGIAVDEQRFELEL